MDTVACTGQALLYTECMARGEVDEGDTQREGCLIEGTGDMSCNHFMEYSQGGPGPPAKQFYRIIGPNARPPCKCIQTDLMSSHLCLSPTEYLFVYCTLTRKSCAQYRNFQLIFWITAYNFFQVFHTQLVIHYTWLTNNYNEWINFFQQRKPGNLIIINLIQCSLMHTVCLNYCKGRGS